MDDIIQEIAKSLQDYTFKTLSEETKLGALNAANAILFPLKEQKVIADYRFSVREDKPNFTVSVFIRETENSKDECWDLTVQGTEE